ncbi:MAG TPA: hypothetical protein PLW48_06420 [Alphaproteobacteria bacterium]|nr:hypothetical protein [Rhodospirillaceae bacterium]HRJ66755.1 hypothetical protein [Alphaproteobacteria bacterium]
MFPQIKLAIVFANLARKHGSKVMHSNNVDLLTKDLSNALVEQKNILSSPRKGAIMTAYEVLPVIAEVKILTVAVAKKLEIDTKGKSDIQVLEEIIALSDARNGGKYAKGIKETLEWTRALVSHPDFQDILKMEMTQIEKPSSVKDVTKFITQIAGRSQDEITRINEFLKHAKELEVPPAPKPEPKAAEPKNSTPKNDGPKPPKPNA